MTRLASVRRPWLSLTSVVGVVLLLQSTPGSAQGVSDSWDPMSGKSLPGIAVVLSGDQGKNQLRVFGGVLVSPTLVATCAAAVEREPIQVSLMAGKGLPARVEREDAASGLVLLRIDAPQLAKQVVPVGTAAGLQPGQPVWFVGPAVNMDRARFQKGAVAAVRFADRVFRIETDIALAYDRRFLDDPAGSPLLDAQGRAVAIATRKPGENTTGFVSSDPVRDMLAKAGVPLR
jgi:hypothetical protein